MPMSLENMLLAIPLAPLIGAIIAGLFGRQIGRAGAHTVTILGVGVAFVLSVVMLKRFAIDGSEPFNGSVYTWLVSDGVKFEIGFLVDNLTALMMTVVLERLLRRMSLMSFFRKGPMLPNRFSQV